MADITVRAIEDINEWENFLATREEANFLQSWHWGEFNKRLGKSINRTGFYKNNKLMGVVQSVVENARRGRYLTVAGGPIIDWGDSQLVKAVFLEIRLIAKHNNCVFVRVRPQLIENEKSLKTFRENDARRAPMHLTADLTSQLDITKSDDELLTAMRKGTRYEIKKAEKLDIKVGSSKDSKQIKKFYDLQLQTAKRQHFVPFGFKFLSEQFKVFSDENKALIFTAMFENKILAQAFIIFYGHEAVYHYGVSTEDGRKYPGAYLLQWEAIKEAKRRGIKKYNFWGIAPENSKSHRFAGVSLFKRGFGGEDIQYLHAQDLVINKQKYLINFLIETIRKKVRKV